MTEQLDPAEGSRVFEEFFDISTGRVDNSVLGWRVAQGLRPSDEYLRANGFCGVVRTPKPQHNPRVARVLPDPSWNVDPLAGTATEVWTVEPLTAEEIAALTAAATAAVREKRNALLRSTDFTQLPDSPISAGDKAKWVAYRKALRDMTKALDPHNPVWPEQPAPSTE